MHNYNNNNDNNNNDNNNNNHLFSKGKMEEAESFVDVRCPPQREMKKNLWHVTNVLTNHNFYALT